MSAPDGDEDRTVVASGPTGPGTVDLATGGGHSGDDTHALPIGTRLNEFELTQRIGEGGFSIVYLAWDHSLERRVAVKEYMPGALASRFGETMIRPRSERHRETFEAGLKSFVNEARLLARFDHPALVKVYRFWEANGTAYLVMPLYEGVTLKETVRAMPQPPNEAWLLSLLAPLTAALEVMHAERCYHRDIAPDNVMMLADGGKPLLLDFGAARRVIGDMTHALTVILKPGFAPVEQYAEIPDLKQGAWTDVYALAATVYWAIIGKTPPASVGRMLSDAYVPLQQSAAGRYSQRFLQAIDRALAVHPDARTQSIAAFRREIGIDPGDGEDTAAAPLSMPIDSDATVIRPIEPAQRARHQMAPRTAAPASQTRPPAVPARAETPPRVAEERPAKSARWPMVIGSLAVVAIVGAGIAWWATKEPAREAATTSQRDDKPAATAPVESKAPAAAVVEPKPDVNGAPAAASRAETTNAPVDPAYSDQRAAELLDPPAQPPPQVTALPPARARKEAATTEGKAIPRNNSASAEKGGKSESGKSANATGRSAECAQIYQRLSLGETRRDLLERAKALNCP